MLTTVKQVVRRAASKNFSSITYPAYVLNAPLTDVSQTSNGVRVASESAHGETATLSVWIDAGSRYENEKNNGAAHFLEQMAFKGTKSRTQKQLEMEIGNMGGNFKSTTSREQTVYTAEVFKGDIPKAMEILSDVLQNPLLDENMMCSERSAIAHKSELALKQYTGRIFDHLHETAFMGTALGRSVIGSEQNVQSLTKGDLMSYMNANYTADRFVIAAAGAVDHRQLLELTEKHFGSLNTIPQGSLTETMEAAIFTGSDKRIRFDSMGEAHIALAFQGASWTSEYAFPLMLIQQILGSWDRTSCIGLNGSSKLTQEIAEHKLAHSYRTINTCYKDTGLFGIYLVCPDNKIEDCMWFTLDNLVRCCHTVSDQEINRAKVQLKANLLMNVDSFSGTAEDIGRQMITYGRRMTRAEMFERIDAITSSDVKSTASKFINDEDHALAAMGPIHELPDYNWIRRRSYWHRY